MCGKKMSPYYINENHVKNTLGHRVHNQYIIITNIRKDPS